MLCNSFPLFFFLFRKVIYPELLTLLQPFFILEKQNGKTYPILEENISDIGKKSFEMMLWFSKFFSAYNLNPI